MSQVIDSFKGRYYFLSNFYEASVSFKGHTYRNNEAAFQAQKCPGMENQFEELPPNRAKALGRRVRLRSDWEQVKDDLMYQIVLEKFKQNPELLEQLADTGDAELIEGNTWGDRYWGVCKGVGMNRLGCILMRVREELR